MSTYVSTNCATERRLGVVVGSVAHNILLALRGPGGMTHAQINARFKSPSNALCQLKKDGLVDVPAVIGRAITLTDKGRETVAPDGPLARRKTLNTYCQL